MGGTRGASRWAAWVTWRSLKGFTLGTHLLARRPGPSRHCCCPACAPATPPQLELTRPHPAPHIPAGGLTKGEEGREKSQRFVLSGADSGASDCQARLAVFNHFISVLGSPGRQPVLSSLLRKTSGRVAQRRLRAPIISCALRSALRSLPGEPVKN